MIQPDQPTIFNGVIAAAVSSVSDGQMQHGWKESIEQVNTNRERLLSALGLEMEKTVLVRVRYTEVAQYDLIRDIDLSDAGTGMFSAEGEAADCLVTKTPGLGLFLPVADCSATIVYDRAKQVLALAHLGRHSTVANLASKLVSHLESKYQSQAADLIVWMSPAIKPPYYLLESADFAQENTEWDRYCTKIDGKFSIDIQGYNRAQFLKAGVSEAQISISEVNTATSSEYWSHYSETTTKGRDAPPRFAVVAALKLDLRKIPA